MRELIIERKEILLGTNVTIKVIEPDLERAIEAIKSAFNEIRRIEDIMSEFRDDSEVSILNHTKFIKNPSKDLVYVLRKSEEYFEIKNIAAFCENVSDPSKKLVMLLGFNLTALGNAHDVYIKVDSMIEKVYPVGDMGKGESKYVEIKLRGYLTHLEEDGYPVEVWIGSSEAEGYITVYIPPENIAILPK